VVAEIKVVDVPTISIRGHLLEWSNVAERGDDVSSCPPATVDFENHKRNREDEHCNEERDQVRTTSVSTDD
jgi:hypothetical protein